MTYDEVSKTYVGLRTLVTNVIGFHDLAENLQKNDSLGQLTSHAHVYADGHVLAWRVFSLSQRLDEVGICPDLAAALRPLRQLCAEIVGAHAWVDDDAVPEPERLMSQAQAYAKGYELALRIIDIDRALAGKE